MTYLWTCFVLFLESVKPKLLTQLFGLFYHPHTLMLRALLWLASIQREKSDLQWSIDRCVVRCLPLPGNNMLLLLLLFLRDGLDPALRPQVFKHLTMLWVFYSWLESMWSGMEPKPQWATQGIMGQTIIPVWHELGRDHSFGCLHWFAANLTLDYLNLSAPL